MSTIYNFNDEVSAIDAVAEGDLFLVHDVSAGTKTKATAGQINSAPVAVVVTTATALSLTLTQHAGKVVIVNTNSTVANTLTLPVATGSGAKYEVVNGIAQTQGSVVIAANGTDIMKGRALSFDSTAVATHQNFFLTTATSDKITWNITTTGGLGNDRAVLYDEAANTWRVFVENNCSGANATPFSAT